MTDHTTECTECSLHEQHLTLVQDARQAYRTDAERALEQHELVSSAALMKVAQITVMSHKAAIFTPRLIVFNETFVPL